MQMQTCSSKCIQDCMQVLICFILALTFLLHNVYTHGGNNKLKGLVEVDVISSQNFFPSPGRNWPYLNLSRECIMWILDINHYTLLYTCTNYITTSFCWNGSCNILLSELLYNHSAILNPAFYDLSCMTNMLKRIFIYTSANNLLQVMKQYL